MWEINNWCLVNQSKGIVLAEQTKASSKLLPSLNHMFLYKYKIYWKHSLYFSKEQVLNIPYTYFK